MASNTWVVMLFSQLIPQAPYLLVCIVGIILCGMWVGRARRAAGLALVGLMLMLLASLGSTMLHALVLSQMTGGGGSAARIGSVMSIIGIVGGIIRAAGLTFVIAGVFAGRPRVVAAGFEVPMARPAQESY